MVGFAVSSFKENGVGGLLAQGLGTSMLQIANIIKNPMISIPPTAAGILLAPLSTMVRTMENSPEGADRGTSGFVGQILTLTSMRFTAVNLLSIATLPLPGPA